MIVVPTLTETLVPIAFGAGLGGMATWLTSWVGHRREMRKLRVQRSTQKAEEALRLVDALELVGPVPAYLTLGEESPPDSDQLSDRKAASAAIAAVSNAAMLIDDTDVRERVRVALNYLGLSTFPGMFKTMPVALVWPDACKDIRGCLAAYARGDELPGPPEMYKHYDDALRPTRESMDRLAEAARIAVERLEDQDEAP